MASKVKREKFLTNWDAVDTLTDHQINLAVANDPDAAPLKHGQFILASKFPIIFLLIILLNK